MTPGFWMHETSGVLRPAIEAYLTGEKMTDEQIAAMRAYLRQWIDRADWLGHGVGKLRDGIDGLTGRKAIKEWLDDAEACGIDPL